MFSKPSAAPPNYVPEHAAKATSPFAGIAYHNLQRKSAIVHASALNHGKDVFLVTNDYFDLSKTIFASVTGKLGLKRVILKARLGNEPCWKNEVKEKIEKEFEEFSQAKENRNILSPKHNQEILNFMESECNFLCEHADGSFMDHLHFCHDYAAVHYTQQSPRVLFLHSILGVGTNIFPMTVDKIDKLRSMLKPDEFKHIEAFPSILRLVNCQTLTNELLSKHKKNELHKLEKISFHRVIDNKPLELTAEDLWIAMNYQMVHQLDFLPCTNWKTEMNDPLFQVFIELYTLLTETGKLVANVNLDLKNSCEKDEFGMPVTLATLISKAVPKSIKRKETISSMVNFSKVIGHDVGYSIIWAK